MRTGAWPSFLERHRAALLPSLLWLGVALLTLAPTPLAVIARFYHTLCARVPVLIAPGRLVPPLPLALLLLVVGVVMIVGVVTGLRELIGTLGVTRDLERFVAPAPVRLTSAAESLALAGRLTYLATAAPVALCYGLLWPRVAISAGLLDRLDDGELAAVLLHERHHLRRCDPLRYLVARSLAAGLFMVPLAPIVMRRAETRIELAADRAALAVVPRGALAGALLTALTAGAAAPAGMASLSATEVRIAHLMGRPEHPRAPVLAGLATMFLAVGIGGAMA